MSRKGRVVLSGMAVAVLFLLPLLPEVLGARRLVFRDAQITHWPWRRVALQSLAAGEVPFVNAAASGGQPLLANPNAVLLYPTVLLETVLPEAAAFNLHYLLHVLWAFAGARRLAARSGASEGAAFFSGVTFAFSGAMLSYGSAFMNSAAAAAWLPWCAAAALDLVRADTTRATLRATAATGAALGLQLLAGEPAITLLTAIFLVFVSLAEVAQTGRERRAGRLRAAVLGGAGSAGIALLLAAPLLLPLRDVFPLTYRGQHLYSERAFGASPFLPWRVVEWLFPSFSGDPGRLGGGAAWLSSIHGGELVYLWSVTFGILPLMVVVTAAVRGDFWRRRSAVLAGAALVTLLFAVGFALPFYRLLYEVDVLRRLRYPIKFYLLTTLCFSLLAGLAADTLRRRRPGAREGLVLAGLIAVFAGGWILAREGSLLERWAGPLLAEISHAPGDFMAAFRGAVQGDALLGVAAALLLSLLLFLRGRNRVAGYALGFATLLLAFRAGLPLFVSASEKELARPPALLRALAGGGRVYVSPRLPRFDPRSLPGARDENLPRVSRVARVLVEQMVPATGAPLGVRYIFDHDPDGSYGFYNRLAGEAVTASSPAERDRLLRLFGARWVLAPEDEPHPLFEGVTGLAVAGRRLVLSENPETVPEIRWVGTVHRRRLLSGALDLLRTEDFDIRRDVVVPGRSDAAPSGSGIAAAVAIRTMGSDRASVAVRSDTAGHVIFSRTHFPSWKATVDGRPSAVLVANARELATAVPAGSHRVAFWYDRAPFHRGVYLQVVGFLALTALAAAGRRRDRGRRRMAQVSNPVLGSSS